MEDGTGTRSSLLWQVERILNELSEADELPDILLMENVPQVHGMGNENAFRKWCNRLTGVRDEDFDKIKDKFSDSTLYHLAGDSIVTTVLMAVLAPMFDKEEKFDYKEKEA